MSGTMNRDDIISFLRDFKSRNADKYGIISLGVFGWTVENTPPTPESKS
jgi:hypothetical protein